MEVRSGGFIYTADLSGKYLILFSSAFGIFSQNISFIKSVNVFGYIYILIVYIELSLFLNYLC